MLVPLVRLWRPDRVRAWCFAAPFFLVPLRPEWFALIAIPLGAYLVLVRRERPALLSTLVVFAVLGGLAHLLAIASNDAGASLPTSLLHRLTTAPGDWLGSQSDGQQNMAPPNALAGLRAWNRSDGANSDAVLVSDGFWRVPRVNPATGTINGSAYVFERLPIEANATYTVSVYVRHDGSFVDFAFSFWTQSGEHRVPATFTPLADGISRAHGSYTTSGADHVFTRVIEVSRFDGDWSHLELGFLQIERGNVPTDYAPPVGAAPKNPWLSLLWWFAVAGSILALLHGSRCLFVRSHGRAVAVWLVLGMTAHAAFAWLEVSGVDLFTDDTAARLASMGITAASRADGFTPHPNLLAHSIVASGLLVWVVRGGVTSLVALLVVLGVNILSGSRTAFIAWFLAVAGWLGDRRYLRRRVEAVAMVVVVALILASMTLLDVGRLDTVLDAADRNVQQRVAAWRAFGKAFSANPLFGTGTGQLEAFATLERTHTPGLGQVAHGHNLIVHFAAESGLLGIAGLLVLLAGIARASLRASGWRGVTVLLVCVVLNLADFTLFWPGVLYPIIAAASWPGLREGR
jgi:hypothetical protein